MKCCVFGASSPLIDPIYIEKTENLCLALAKAGHSLVFGAGANGLMGAAARGFTAGGGEIIGVIPTFFRDEEIEAIYDKCDQLIYTETMQQRKFTMEEQADAFIIVPGGIGTFEEFFEVLTLKQLGRHTKPILIYDINGYYQPMEKMMDHAQAGEFLNEKCRGLYEIVNTPDAILFALSHPDEPHYSVHQLKDG